MYNNFTVNLRLVYTEYTLDSCKMMCIGIITENIRVIHLMDGRAWSTVNKQNGKRALSLLHVHMI